MPRPLSACAAADRGRRVRRPYEGSFFVCRGEACLPLSPHARLLIEGDACVALRRYGSLFRGLHGALRGRGGDLALGGFLFQPKAVVLLIPFHIDRPIPHGFERALHTESG